MSGAIMTEYGEDLATLFARFLAAQETLFHRFLGPSNGADENPLQLVARKTTAAWEPLTVTFENTPQSGQVWVITRLTLHGVCAVNPPNSQSPITGLFMVQSGTPEETLAEAQGAAGWNIVSRGVPLPAGVVVGVTPIPGALGNSYAYQISLTQSSPLILFPGQTLRGVINCNPATAQPGPGAGSFGILTAMGSIHSNQRGAVTLG